MYKEPAYESYSLPHCQNEVTSKVILYPQWSKYNAQHDIIFLYDIKVATNQDFDVEFEILLLYSQKK